MFGDRVFKEVTKLKNKVLWVGPDPIRPVSLYKEFRTQTLTEERPREDTGRGRDCLQAKAGGREGNRPASSLISDF